MKQDNEKEIDKILMGIASTQKKNDKIFFLFITNEQ